MYRLLYALLIICGFGSSAWAQETTTGKDVWAPLRPLIGKWTGDRSGLGGEATQSTEWKFVLGGQFIQCSTKTIKGKDPHADIGMISFDKQRKKFVYRSYFSEGFVNQYVGTISSDGKKIEFVSEKVENGPPGLKVKEVWDLSGKGLKVECFLASGDKPFKSCIVAHMKKDK